MVFTSSTVNADTVVQQHKTVSIKIYYVRLTLQVKRFEYFPAPLLFDCKTTNRWMVHMVWNCAIQKL